MAQNALSIAEVAKKFAMSEDAPRDQAGSIITMMAISPSRIHQVHARCWCLA